MRQYTLVQCPACKRWYIVGVDVSKTRALTFDHIYVVEQTLKDECQYTHHKGRRKASS